jgi:hypothetical protein
MKYILNVHLSHSSHADVKLFEICRPYVISKYRVVFVIITLRAEKGGEPFRRRAIGKQSVKADGEDIRGESVGNQLGIDCESMGKTGNLQPLAAENSRSSSLENLLASHP